LYNCILYILDVVQIDDFENGSRGFSDRVSCPLLIHDTMVIFGGQNEKRQISIIYKNLHKFGAHRIQSLPFSFSSGKCYFSNGIVYLCFPHNQGKLCHIT